MKVGILYRCECMKERVSLDVPERLPAVDILMWMNDIVVPRVVIDHIKHRTPGCQASTIAELLLPAPPDGIIGGQRVSCGKKHVDHDWPPTTAECLTLGCKRCGTAALGPDGIDLDNPDRKPSWP